MSAYRLSPLRTRGWIRLGLIGALAMIPLTVMKHAQGQFAEGQQGLIEAVEYMASGMVLALLAAMGAAWGMRGFAIRVKTDEDEDSRPSSLSHSSAPAAHHPPPGHGGGKPH